jgi:hypothetical protein
MWLATVARLSLCLEWVSGDFMVEHSHNWEDV